MIRGATIAAAVIWFAAPGLALAQAPADQSAAAEATQENGTQAKSPPKKSSQRRSAPVKERAEGARKPEPSTPMMAAPQEPPPNLTVLCEARPARYAAEAGVPIWVLRSGVASVENPLRPLTPDTTRVLQVVVGDRNATAYGPDLAALRRGGTAAALEATLGVPIRWDQDMTLLPDSLVIVSEANETLARLPFRDCSDAPTVKADPVRPKPEAKAPAKPRRPVAAAPKAPPGLNIPQGAIAAPPEAR